MNAADPAAHEAALRFADAWRDRGGFVIRQSRDGTLLLDTTHEDDRNLIRLTEPQLRAVLDENARMREELERLRAARTSLDGQTFISGWYAHAEACASLGWDAREAAWRKYREEMAATLGNAEATPQQPAPNTADEGAEHG